MRTIAIGLVSLALLGPAAAAEQSATAGGGCAQAVQALQQEWQTAGYPLPTKQTQASITSLDGTHHASAAEINNMRLRIRLAREECAQGNETASLQYVAAVRSMIGTSSAVATKQ